MGHLSDDVKRMVWSVQDQMQEALDVNDLIESLTGCSSRHEKTVPILVGLVGWKLMKAIKYLEETSREIECSSDE